MWFNRKTLKENIIKELLDAYHNEEIIIGESGNLIKLRYENEINDLQYKLKESEGHNFDIQKRIDFKLNRLLKHFKLFNEYETNNASIQELNLKLNKKY